MSVWFVTGAARGMGASFVEAALGAGHQVVATARRPEEVTRLFGERDDRMGALAQEVAPFGIHTTIVNPGFFRTGLASLESLVWPEVTVEDYAERSAAQREWWQAQDGRQPGDPAKLAQALLTIAAEDPPPARFIAGADVIALAERRMADLRAQIESHRILSSSLTVDEFVDNPVPQVVSSTEDPFVHELWVRGHDGERGVLSHNPHTHPGRFSVLWESTGDTHATSISQLADMSPLARAWLAGYLFGNEPDPWDVLGKDPDDEITDDEYDVWWEKLAEFRRAGGMVLPIRED